MMTLLDRYIIKRLLDYLFLGIVIFTLVLFFSNALLDFMKDLQHYGISWDIAATLIGLQIPRIVAVVIPMGALLATLMVYNTLNNQFELISMRMSGISLYRLAVPAIIIGIAASGAAYLLHDYVVPKCYTYSRALKTYAIDQQNLPATNENFIYKQFDQNQQLKRLLYISHFHKKHLGYTTMVDLTNPKTLQVIQAHSGLWGQSAIELSDADIYTVSSTQKVSNTTRADHLQLQHFIQPPPVPKEYLPKELSFWGMRAWLEKGIKKGHKFAPSVFVTLWEKLMVPLSSIPLVLVAVPLAVTPPRKLSNIGFLASILILFFYYLIQHISVQLGNSHFLPPLLAASLPLIIISGVAIVLFQRKNQVL